MFERLFLSITFILFLLPLTSSAQGWERAYGHPQANDGQAIKQLPDGSFVALGTQTGLSTDSSEIQLLKIDADGLEEWTKSFGVVGGRATGSDIFITANQQYAISGTRYLNGSQNGQLLLTDALGNSLWTYMTTTDSVLCRAVIELKNGGYAMVGNHLKNITIDGMDMVDRDVFLCKINPDGTAAWEITFGSDWYDEGFGLTELPNESILVGGSSVDQNGQNFDAFVAKITSGGWLIWNKKYDGGHKELAYDITTSPYDQTIWLTGMEDRGDSYHEDMFVLQIDNTGEIQQWQHIESEGYQTGRAIEVVGTQEVVVAGESRNFSSSPRNLMIAKVTSSGPIWARHFGGTQTETGADLEVLPDGGVVAIGKTYSYGNGQSDIYIVRSDATGTSFSNVIHGQIGISNADCEPETYTAGAPFQLIQADGDETYFTITDEFGFYEMYVPPGNYDVSVVGLQDYWTVCDPMQTVTLSSPFDIVQVLFTIIPNTVCPAMNTDIAVNHLRPGFSSTYSVTYCNEGTTNASQATLEVTLDEWMTFDSASTPPLAVNDQAVNFFVGNVPIFDCTTIQLYVTLDSTVAIGQTHCVTSQVMPDTLCHPVDPDWDFSSVRVMATCATDSIRFRIVNEGWGDMDDPQPFIVIEDQIIGMQGNFQLTSGQDTLIAVETNGSTFRLEAEQSLGHPGDSEPIVAVEGCGGEPFSKGYIIDFPLNDGNPFVEIDCRENTGSFDPNDKQAFPGGYDDPHYIEANQPIEYLIRFQNEGTDTAFRVIIRDTISHHLDIASIQTGAASHPYTYRVYGENILEFTFDNILLPHQAVNDLGSMGFVKFKINQRLDLPIGTEIFNSAGIYFDFNAPIITNETYHTIGENFVIVDPIANTENIEILSEKDILVYPNPFTDYVIFDLQNRVNTHEAYQFVLFNSQSQQVHQAVFSGNTYRFEKGDLPAGFYFFSILSDGQVTGNGRLVMGR